jgi:hypothetical protein
LGLRRIDINPGLFPWKEGKRQDVMAKYDAVVQAARSAGMRIVLNPQYSPTYHKISSLDAWSSVAIPVYEELARRYKPDVFNVAHEPSTMAKRMGAKNSIQAWRDFARRAAQAIKRESPQTKVAAGGLYTEQEYFNEFLNLSEVDLMSINIYDLKGLKTYNAMIEDAQARGKNVYIAETWRPPYFQPKLGPRLSLESVVAKSIGDRDFEDVDIHWLETMVEYARAWGLQSVTPFWTQAFFKYVGEDGDALSESYNNAAASAIRNEERTRLFRRYQELIRTHGGR